MGNLARFKRKKSVFFKDENIKFHAPSYSLHFNNTDHEMTEYELEDTRNVLILNGNDLKISELVQLGTGKFKIQLSEETYTLIRDSRKVVEDLMEGNSSIYGINTGFGKFATTIIPGDQLE